MYWDFFFFFGLNIAGLWKFCCVWKGGAFSMFWIRFFSLSFYIYHLPIYLHNYICLIHLFSGCWLCYENFLSTFFAHLHSHFLRIVLIFFILIVELSISPCIYKNFLFCNHLVHITKAHDYYFFSVGCTIDPLHTTVSCG